MNESSRKISWKRSFSLFFLFLVSTASLFACTGASVFFPCKGTFDSSAFFCTDGFVSSFFLFETSGFCPSSLFCGTGVTDALGASSMVFLVSLFSTFLSASFTEVSAFFSRKFFISFFFSSFALPCSLAVSAFFSCFSPESAVFSCAARSSIPTLMIYAEAVDPNVRLPAKKVMPRAAATFFFHTVEHHPFRILLLLYRLFSCTSLIETQSNGSFAGLPALRGYAFGVGLSFFMTRTARLSERPGKATGIDSIALPPRILTALFASFASSSE